MNIQTSGWLMIVIGIVLLLSNKFPLAGRLPLDIYIKGRHGSVFLPIGTCILISVIFSIVLSLFKK